MDYLGSTSILSEESPGREKRYTQTQEAIDLIKVGCYHDNEYSVSVVTLCGILPT